MSEEKHAKCAYCGTTESSEWKTSPANFRLYCSTDCKRAGELPNFLCGLVIVSAIVTSLWSGFAATLSFADFGVFLILLTAFLCLSTGIPTYRGMKARARVSKRPEPDEIYC